MTDHDTIREWLKTVPKKLLLSEVGRRNNKSRRVHSGGRPKVLKPCPKCGGMFGARELVRACPEHLVP
jgi:hypothetical protein